MPYKDASVRKLKAVEYSRKYYLANKEKSLVLNAKNRKKKRVAWQEFKASLSCTKCNFSHPAALDFHHVDRTDHRSVNKLVQDGQYKKAHEEIKKCIVLCANCHRIHHHEENLIQSP